MKFKLDENLSVEVAKLIKSYHHDVPTVFDEKLNGQPDAEIFKKCIGEARCLITLDLDFADVTRFNPKKNHGIIVIRLPKNSSHSYLISMIKQTLEAVKTMEVTSQLWVIEPGRIRIHQTE